MSFAVSPSRSNENMAIVCLAAHQRADWNAWINRVPHDFYHRAEYHLLAEQRGEGRAFLAVCGDADRFLAWPYLLLPLSSTPGLEFTDRCDVTSVYGYPGPLARACSGNGPFLQQALRAVCELWCEQKVVSAFTRFNPLLSNAELPAALGTLIPSGQTVSVNLEIPLEQSWAAYRRGHRYEIQKGKQAGLQFIHDQDWQHLDEFVSLYAQAMQRKGATGRYLFDAQYFATLRDALGETGHLLLATQGSQIAAAGIFAECCRMVQYHLSAVRESCLALAPAKVLLDGARVWAKARGNRVLHLGGGVGGADDSLFLFKAGFSSARHAFFVWRATLDEDTSASLAAARENYCALHGLASEEPNFFPAYRQPLVSAAQLSAVHS